MKIGAVYPQTEIAGDTDALRRFVLAVEELGFDYLLAYDHVVAAPHDREPKLAGPYTEQHPFHDPFALFAYAAGITERLEFATGVLILPQRQTVLVAKQAADVDILSKGRLRLGVGSGWNYVEYHALGQDFHTRGRRLDEQIGLLRELWSSSLVTFEGQFDRIDRGLLNPRPRRAIPIWMGGWSEPALRRAARLGDGFIFAGDSKLAEAGWTRLRGHLAEVGRPEADFGRDLIVRLTATAGETADNIKVWRDLGGTHACISTMEKGFSSVEAHIELLAHTIELVGE